MTRPQAASSSPLLASTLLVLALVAPVAVFLLLGSYLRGDVLAAAAAAVVAGWVLNVTWALLARRAGGPAHVGAHPVSMATRFGWVCPTVLVLVTWLVRGLAT